MNDSLYYLHLGLFFILTERRIGWLIDLSRGWVTDFSSIVIWEATDDFTCNHENELYNSLYSIFSSLAPDL